MAENSGKFLSKAKVITIAFFVQLTAYNPKIFRLFVINNKEKTSNTGKNSLKNDI